MAKRYGALAHQCRSVSAAADLAAFARAAAEAHRGGGGDGGGADSGGGVGGGGVGGGVVERYPPTTPRFAFTTPRRPANGAAVDLQVIRYYIL